MFVFSSTGLSAAVAGPFAASTVRLTAEIARKCFMVSSVVFRRLIFEIRAARS
jgi:hypothetical protein